MPEDKISDDTTFVKVEDQRNFIRDIERLKAQNTQITAMFIECKTSIQNLEANLREERRAHMETKEALTAALERQQVLQTAVENEQTARGNAVGALQGDIENERAERLALNVRVNDMNPARLGAFFINIDQKEEEKQGRLQEMAQLLPKQNQLVKACEEGDLEKVERLLTGHEDASENAHPAYPNSKGQIPLLRAVYGMNPAVVRRIDEASRDYYRANSQTFNAALWLGEEVKGRIPKSTPGPAWMWADMYKAHISQSKFLTGLWGKSGLGLMTIDKSYGGSIRLYKCNEPKPGRAAVDGTSYNFNKHLLGPIKQDSTYRMYALESFLSDFHRACMKQTREIIKYMDTRREELLAEGPQVNNVNGMGQGQ